jgi:hypothetical protein
MLGKVKTQEHVFFGFTGYRMTITSKFALIVTKISALSPSCLGFVGADRADLLCPEFGLFNLNLAQIKVALSE